MSKCYPDVGLEKVFGQDSHCIGRDFPNTLLRYSCTTLSGICCRETNICSNPFCSSTCTQLQMSAMRAACIAYVLLVITVLHPTSFPPLNVTVLVL
jgi:hypothetical protein